MPAELTRRLREPELRPGASRFYVPELDSLRFFAFLSVFVCHLFAVLGSPLFLSNIGTFGVDLFFTLSAYLITELLMREKEQFGKLNVGSFYLRRALRIWPLYLGFVAAVFAVLRIRPIVRVSNAYFIFLAIFLGNFGAASGRQAAQDW
ncbi:MAG: acyltransferase family protein [Candidatus Binataceae bacterium]